MLTNESLPADRVFREASRRRPSVPVAPRRAARRRRRAATTRGGPGTGHTRRASVASRRDRGLSCEDGCHAGGPGRAGGSGWRPGGGSGDATRPRRAA